jgi:hypothetical protein
MKCLPDKRRRLGLFLAALLTVSFAIKAIHPAGCCEQEAVKHVRPDCAGCPICYFSFSLFIETEILDVTIITCPLAYKILLYAFGPVKRILHSFHLRAPPPGQAAGFSSQRMTKRIFY